MKTKKLWIALKRTGAPILSSLRKSEQGVWRVLTKKHSEPKQKKAKLIAQGVRVVPCTIAPFSFGPAVASTEKLLWIIVNSKGQVCLDSLATSSIWAWVGFSGIRALPPRIYQYETHRCTAERCILSYNKKK